MAFLTIPTISKGAINTLTLTKSDLAAFSVVSADSYFSDSANWSNVTVTYKSSTGNQQKVVQFPITGASTSTGSLVLSANSRDAFNIQNVVIFDFDGGSLPIARSDIPSASSYDVSIGSVSSVFSNTLKASQLTLSDLSYGLNGSSAPVVSWGYLTNEKAKASGGKFYAEFTLSNSITNQTYLGASFLNSTPAVFADGSFPFTAEGGSSKYLYWAYNTSGTGGSGVDNSYSPPPYFAGDTVGIAVDLDNLKVWININGTWTGNPATNTGGSSIATGMSTKSTFYLAAAVETGKVLRVATPSYKPVGFDNY